VTASFVLKDTASVISSETTLWFHFVYLKSSRLGRVYEADCHQNKAKQHQDTVHHYHQWLFYVRLIAFRGQWSCKSWRLWLQLLLLGCMHCWWCVLFLGFFDNDTNIKYCVHLWRRKTENGRSSCLCLLVYAYFIMSVSLCVRVCVYPSSRLLAP